MFRTGWLRLVAALLCVAATPADEALLTVKENLASAKAIVDREVPRPDKADDLVAVAREITDTETMGRRALGERLEGIPEEQQIEFFALFDELLLRTYIQKLLFFKKPKFGYRPPEQREDGVFVYTKILTSKDEFYVDYAMAELDGRWVARDIVVEGNSLTDIYEFQFDGILADRSFEELLELMRRKTRVLRREAE
jgi:phospholipid transport system substrate-binding protein